MPGKFGSILRASVQRDPDSMKRNLNMYILGEDIAGKFVKCNSTIKNNLKTWLNNYRMINDTIDILDPYIINLSISFVVQSAPNSDKHLVFEECLAPSVVDVISVQILPRTGAEYSSNTILIGKSISPDGGKLICPKNAVFEFKYPDVDFKGKIR